MPTCKKCGKLISNEQYLEFDGLCTQCKRLSYYKKFESGEGLKGLGVIFTCMSIGLWSYVFLPVGNPIYIAIPIALAVTIIGILFIYFGYKKSK